MGCGISYNIGWMDVCMYLYIEEFWKLVSILDGLMDGWM